MSEQLLTLLDGIQKHVTCVQVKLSLWQGRRQLPDAEIKLAGDAVESENVTAPQGKFIPPEWEKVLRTFTKRRNALLSQHSLPHLVTGCAAVRSTRLGGFMLELNTIREDLHACREELISKWDEVVEFNRAAWREKWHDYYDPTTGQICKGLRHCLPNPNELRKKIELSWTEFSIVPGSAEISGLDASQIEALQRATSSMMAEKVQEFIDQILQGPREALRTSVVRLADSLTNNTNVTPATFNEFRSAVSLLKEFHDLPSLRDDVLQERIRAMEDQLAGVPARIGANGRELQSLDISAVGPVLQNALAGIADRCADRSVTEQMERDYFAQYGRYPRQLL